MAIKFMQKLVSANKFSLERGYFLLGKIHRHVHKIYFFSFDHPDRWSFVFQLFTLVK